MTKRKMFFAFILAIFLFVPGMFLLSACGDDGLQIGYIRATLNGNYSETDNLYTEIVDYGDTENLDNFGVKVFYTNGTTKDLSFDDVTIKVEHAPINTAFADSTLESYMAKVADGTLDAGVWSINFCYDIFSSQISITVNKIEDDSSYALTLRDGLHTYLEENCIEYGTKIDAIKYDVIKDCGITSINESQIEGLYMLCTIKDNIIEYLKIDDFTEDDFSKLPMPNMVGDADGFDFVKLENTENMECGAYYVCAKIYGGNNHFDTWTEYVKFKIGKAKYFVTTEDFAITYTYNGNLQTQDLLFSEIMADSANVKISGTMKLVVKSDMKDDNDSVVDSTNKKTLEQTYTKIFDNAIWNVVDGEESPCMFGNLVDVDQSARYNFEKDGHDIRVILVPYDENSQVFAESDNFKIKLVIARGTIASPTVSQSSEVFDDEENPGNQSLSVYINCEKTKVVAKSDYDTALAEFKNNILVLSTNTHCEHSQNSNVYTFYTSEKGEYYIKIFVNPNFVFDTESFESSDLYTITFEEETEDCAAYLTISWSITE